MLQVGKMRIDKPKQMGFLILSIPAKPLVQAKLKCGRFFVATRNRRPVEQQRMEFDLCESQFQRGLRGSSSPNNQAMAGCQRNGAGSGGRGGSVSNVSSSGMAPGYSAAAAVRARTSRA